LIEEPSEALRPCSVDRSVCGASQPVTEQVANICKDKKSCSVYVSKDELGIDSDPCEGVFKLLTTVFKCVDPDTREEIVSAGPTSTTPGTDVEFASVCLGDRLSLECSDGQQISKVIADFGRPARGQYERCPTTSTASCPPRSVSAYVEERCLGAPHCSVQISKRLGCDSGYLLPGVFQCEDAANE
jgi:hypothetical protein